ncbi:MAG: YfhO family protein [Bacilli bacterium]|nr:YfhO family protein [Bacilli bacterium]
MKKIDKKDIINCLLLSASFLLFFFIITRFKYAYGSTLDWESQHSIIPDYFRALFYKTFDLFPDFAFNLGNGQNIYNFSYYGLLSPIIMLSYLFPFLNMATYLSLASVLVVISSSIIFYFWNRQNNKKSHTISFILGFILLFSTSLTLHSHRHLMFVYYMPFLMLGLFGVDKKLVNDKGWLLSISVFLMVMTSYYYSISGIICLTIYGIYKYIEITPEITLKNFIKTGSKFALSIIIGIMMSMIIILPTFNVIFSSRGKTFNTITLKDLLIPGANIKYVLYESYGMGLTAILILAILNLLFKKREKRILGITLLLFILFPFINYLLNATMYIDGKILIPMIPLALITIGYLLEDLIENELDFRPLLVAVVIFTLFVIYNGDHVYLYLIDITIVTFFFLLYKKFSKKSLILIPTLLIPFVISLVVSYNDPLVNYKNKIKNDDAQREAIKWITEKDKDIYRISNERTILRDVNNIYGNIDYYSSTLYSSTYNLDYNRFYYDTINNPIQNRNRVITSPTSNILFLLYSGNKYVITKKNDYLGYELIEKIGSNKIYKTEGALPIAYAIKNTIGIDEFSKMDYPKKAIALLKNVIIEGKTDTNFESNIEELEIDLSKLKVKNATLKEENGHYILEAGKEATGKIPLPEELKDKIIFIRFRVEESAPCKKGDTGITIEGVENKLTCKEWKYHNQNYDFDYVIAKKDLSSLSLEFKKGTYEITNIKAYSLDYSEIQDVRNDIDEFEFDKEKTKGDKIAGAIDVSEDGYFVSSIPYDKGFKVKLDDRYIDYEKVNEAFLGFKIEKGKHDISIEYEAPYKKIGLLFSFIGVLLFSIITIVEKIKN